MNTSFKSNDIAKWRRQIISAVCLGAFLFVTTTFAQTPALRANGKIAFTSNRDGNQEIYVVNNDGTGQVRLTNNPGVDNYPTWSRDGTKIAFVSQRSAGDFAISVMNADGTNKVEITPINYSESYWAGILSWSPDGNRIAFQDNNDIFVVNVNGSNRQILVNDPAIESEPSWSPDGSKILFSRFNQPIPDIGPILHTIKPDGTDLQALPDGFANGFGDFSPNWSPSGDKITFLVNVYDYSVAIYTANADGTNRQLFEGCTHPLNCRTDTPDNGSPVWSPDGNKIIFHSFINNSSIIGDREIYAKNVDGGGLIQLTNTTGGNFNPSWQPLTAKSRKRIRFF
jgi:TolB protein